MDFKKILQSFDATENSTASRETVDGGSSNMKTMKAILESLSDIEETTTETLDEAPIKFPRKHVAQAYQIFANAKKKDMLTSEAEALVVDFAIKELGYSQEDAEMLAQRAGVKHIDMVGESDDEDDRDELTKKLFPRRSRDDMETSDRERNRAMNAKRFMKPGKPNRSREWGAYESVSEAEEGTYMKQWYNYSEDFAMLELYVDGELVDKWSDYFGANETGNPLEARFIEMAKENGIDPVGLKVIDGDDGTEGVFTSSGLKWNSNEVTEAAKPDFADIDGDGDKDEPMKKAAKDKKDKVDEAIMVSAEGSEAEALLQILQLAGTSAPALAPAPVPAAPTPTSSYDSGPLPALVEPEDDMDMDMDMDMQDEYSNSPDEFEQDIDAVIASGNDLHKEKEQFPATAPGDNPIRAFEGRFKAILDELLAEDK